MKALLQRGARALPTRARHRLGRWRRGADQAIRAFFSVPRYRNVVLDCGVTVRVDMHHRNWRRFRAHRSHERDVERFIVAFLRDGDVVLDVGAQIGMFTGIAAQLIGDGGRLLAFEPDARNRGELERTCARNRLENVTILATGLSDTDGEATFHRPDGAWGAFMDGSGDGRVTRASFSSSVISSVTVPVRTIDSVVRERGLQRLDLIKIDVDGPEVAVLRGALQTLSTLRPAVLVEASGFYREHGATVQDLLSLLHELGYEIHGTERNGDHTFLVTSADDLPEDPFATGAAMDFFCVVPGTYAERRADLPLPGGA